MNTTFGKLSANPEAMAKFWRVLGGQKMPVKDAIARIKEQRLVEERLSICQQRQDELVAKFGTDTPQGRVLPRSHPDLVELFAEEITIGLGPFSFGDPPMSGVEWTVDEVRALIDSGLVTE